MMGLPEKFPEFLSLLDRYAPDMDLNSLPENVDSIQWGGYRISRPSSRSRHVDIPAFWIVGQGTKYTYSGTNRYDFIAGKSVIIFYPMAVESEIMNVSPEKPLLVAGAAMNLPRMLSVLQRIEQIEGPSKKVVSADPSGIMEVKLTNELLDPFIRLFHLIERPTDAAILTDSILDEIYYRLLSSERGAELRYLLRQRGEIQRISKAVEYIHRHLHEPVSVEKLAAMVHMAQPTFYENFRSVMHTSPLQYAKSIKLDRAQQLIRQGKKANEAGYLVGYNSPAQFSREYKRHFGYAPSATV